MQSDRSEHGTENGSQAHHDMTAEPNPHGQSDAGVAPANGASGSARQDDAPVQSGSASRATTVPIHPPRRSPEAILTSLSAFPDELARSLADQSTEALLSPARDGGWGVVEILPHLRDWEEIHLERVCAIIEQDRPDLPSFDDDLWAIERDYRGQDPHETLDQFRELREDLVTHLRDLPPEAWERTGDHAIFGEISLHWLGDHISNHDQEHLDQVRDALA